MPTTTLSQGDTATTTMQETDVRRTVDSVACDDALVTKYHPIEDRLEQQGAFSWDGVMLTDAQMSSTPQGDTAISTAALTAVCDTLVPFVPQYKSICIRLFDI